MWAILSTAADNWSRHRSARLGAALAYYSVFSLGPLLLIVTAVAGFFFGTDAVRGSLTEQFRGLLGETGAQAVEAMLKGAASSTSGGWSAVVGIGLLLVAALGVVAQLKDALNTIFEAKEPDDAGLAWYARVYGTSLAGILALGFLLAVSLVISTLLSAVSAWIGGSASQGLLLQLINFAVSLGVLTLLFAMLFKWFPDTPMSWRLVWPGAFATALLFNVGKSAISWYIGTQGLESTYGAAASIVVLLIWVYYSAQIVLFGAELTHAYAAITLDPGRLAHPGRGDERQSRPG
jgi:membrane protein